MESLFTSPEFQMSLLLFVALAGYLVASRINQSAVIGLILVGIVVGPSVLGWITYTDFVQALAHLGAVILLFVIGFEFNMKDIVQPRNFAIALVGVIVPWIGGWWLAILFGFDSASAIFVGTACTATSIAITANVLKEMGKLQTEAAKVIIGAAVIDDVLALLALAISTDVVGGSFSYLGIAIVTVKAIAFIVIAAAFGILVVSKYLVKLGHNTIREEIPGVHLHLCNDARFPVCLVRRGCRAFGNCRRIHCRCIIQGRRASPKPQPQRRCRVPPDHLRFDLLRLTRHYRRSPCGHPGDLIIPAFLDPCSYPDQGNRLRNSGKARRVVHEGCAHCRVRHGTPGEVAMIVALIGLESGIIGQGIYVALVMMSLLTTIITPIVYRNWFYRGECCGYDKDGTCIDEGK